jgi:hypothetical protein
LLPSTFSGVGKNRVTGMDKKTKYHKDDAICVECIEDRELRALIKSQGREAACALCEKVT